MEVFGGDESRGGGAPPLRFRCAGCGYGATRAEEPDRCPMCGDTVWDLEPWRPFSALLEDTTARRRSPDTNEP